MKQAGMRGLWIDGGYDSYENIGWLNINGIKPHFHIHGNRVPNPAGSVEHLKALEGGGVQVKGTNRIHSHIPVQPRPSRGCGRILQEH